MSSPIPSASPNPLTGRRIVIDPGHGGNEAGAIGPTGLRECEVNLKVCFRLAELFCAEGAVPILTRTEDVSVSIGDRPALCKKEDAELFLSVHHNANAQNDRTVNRSEVYYQWKERHAPSHDLAREVLRELKQTFHLAGSRTYVTYSYGVLRMSETTAVLAEAFYIANPDAEASLREDETINREAEAIFRAVKRFYGKGRLHLQWCDDEICCTQAAPRQFVARVFVEWGTGVDPHTICALLDGKRVPHCYDADKNYISILAQVPDSGTAHTLEIQARNMNGISARPLVREFQGSLDQCSDAVIRTDSTDCVLLVTDQENNPVDGAFLLFDGKACAQTDRTGIVALPNSATENSEEAHKEMRIHAQGYLPTSISPEHCRSGKAKPTAVILNPLFDGILHGKTFILDPEHGGDDPGAVAADGLRAADVNLSVARRLAAYLQTAGAAVCLTRNWDETMDDEARVRFGLEHEVAHFLCIDHLAFRPGENDPPDLNATWVLQKWDWKNCQFYFNSLLSELLRLLKTPKGEIRGTSTWQSLHAQRNYSVTQVSPMLISAPGAAERLRHAGCLDKIALGLLHGLVRFHLEIGGLDGANASELSHEIWGTIVDPKDGRPINAACVSLADTLSVQTEPDGEFRFRFLAEGSYPVRVDVPGLPSRVLILDASEEGHMRQIVLK